MDFFCLVPCVHTSLSSSPNVRSPSCCSGWFGPSLTVYHFVPEQHFVWPLGCCPVAEAWTSVCRLKEHNTGENKQDFNTAPASIKAESWEPVPALLYSSNIICLILCLCCRASISLGRVTSSWGSVSPQEGRGGRFCSRGLMTDATSKKTGTLSCCLYFLNRIKKEKSIWRTGKHSSQLISDDKVE